MKIYLAVTTLLTALMSSVSAQDTVQVKTGWNIIGSVKAGAVPDVLSSIPDSIITTSFYGYAPDVGYQSTDTLGKGLGYWVKVKSDGIIIFHTSGSPDACGVKRVDYGGISYGTVQIGSQCWLNENLNVGTMITGVTEQTNNATLEKYCYADNLVNCGAYGGLYQWDEAMQYTTTPGTQGICPVGWHIPTNAEFLTLYLAVSGDGNVLKKGGQGTGSGAGTNISGFSALLAGNRRAGDGSFYPLGATTVFWSSVEADVTIAFILNLFSASSSIDLSWNPDKAYGFSVRCLED